MAAISQISAAVRVKIFLSLKFAIVIATAIKQKKITPVQFLTIENSWEVRLLE